MVEVGWVSAKRIIHPTFQTFAYCYEDGDPERKPAIALSIWSRCGPSKKVQLSSLVGSFKASKINSFMFAKFPCSYRSCQPQAQTQFAGPDRKSHKDEFHCHQARGWNFPYCWLIPMSRPFFPRQPGWVFKFAQLIIFHDLQAGR